MAFIHTLAIGRLAVRTVRLVGFAIVLAAVLAINVVPRLGHALIIIRGLSMEPNVPLGSMVVESAPTLDRLVPGAIVAFTTSTGVVITHRIVDGPSAPADGADGTATDGGTASGPTVLTKGDANDGPDPARIPVASITGLADQQVPVAGFLLAWLQLPSGLISVISLLACLVVTEWLLEDVEEDVRSIDETDPEPARGGPGPEPATS